MSFIIRVIRFLKKRILIRELNKTLYVSRQVHLDFQGKVSISPGCTLSEGVIIQVPINGSLDLGRGVFVGKDSEISPGGHISIGAKSSIQVRSILLGNISMGSGCICAPNLYVSSGEHHFKDYPELPIKVQDAIAREIAEDSDEGLVTIGDDCWLGINVVIMRGVTIGKGCVIGANSVVTHDISPYSVAVGSPAKVIKKRLEFTPPKSIFANQDIHYPYFYSGIKYLGKEESLGFVLYRENEGYLVDNNFVLVLNICDGEFFFLELWASFSGEISYQGVTQSFTSGKISLKFGGTQASSNFLEFQTTIPTHQKLIVLKAEVLCNP